MPRASVVIPAYNEEQVIGRCLSALQGVDLLVVVAANGCTDATAARARAHGVHVVEVDTASKVAALNAGDAACGDVFPRIYLDADVELSGDSARKLIERLCAAPEPLVCAPAIRFDVAAASVLVKSFYDMYARLPYLTEGMVGAGCYAVNAAGRARWGSFPDITADDLYVQGLFAPHEREVVPDATFTVWTPRTLRSLLRVRIRSYQGKTELETRELSGSMAQSRQRSVRSMVRQVREQPRLAPALATYLAVNVIAVYRARFTARRGAWLTDSTSRTSAG